ncbi:MAG: NUDIX hydrolase [Mycobacteriales bacterium]
MPGRRPAVDQDQDREHDYDVVSSETRYRGRIISVRKDVVKMPGDTTSPRDVVEHPGAVGVVALDGTGRVLLVNQYRHPVRRRLDELPAGLLDVEGEPALETAKRELAEEAGYAADTWHVLVDTLTSSGMTDEAIRVFLARDLRVVDRDVQEHEEADMTSCWLDLPVAVQRVMAGELENGMAAVGLLAADRAARDGFTGLRPSDAPWPSRKTGA